MHPSAPVQVAAFQRYNVIIFLETGLDVTVRFASLSYNTKFSNHLNFCKKCHYLKKKRYLEN